MDNGIALERLGRDEIAQGLDHDKLEALILDGFKRALVPGYFEQVDPNSVYLAKSEDRYLGSIVMIDTDIGIPYLDKIVVASDKQDNGIGRQMWDMMNGDHPKLFWRAKPENPINKFYLSVCEGMQRVDGWNIYWIGLNPAELEKAIEYAIHKPETLKSLNIPHSDS